MKERPASFKGPLVRAILIGEKMQTRRLIRFDPEGALMVRLNRWVPTITDGPRCPFGTPGDRLWVRETARVLAVSRDRRGRIIRLCYEADDSETEWLPYPERLAAPVEGKRIANGVYREGARLFLDVTAVRMERFQSISEEDAKEEGIHVRSGREGSHYHHDSSTPAEHWWNCPIDAFHDLWDSLAPVGARWQDNPWVWVVGFARWMGGVRP